MPMCGNCRRTIPFVRMTEPMVKEDKAAFTISYDCPHCKYSQSIQVTYEGPELVKYAQQSYLRNVKLRHDYILAHGAADGIVKKKSEPDRSRGVKRSIVG